jgi:hypothetical protein
MRTLSVLLLTSLLTVSACSKVGSENVTSPTPLPRNGGSGSGNNPTPTPVQSSKIEFRVAGNAVSARIRFTNAQDGTTILTSTLPYITTVTTTESSMFISLEATPTSYPFGITNPYLAVQIFVNGSLFREAISEDFYYNTVSVSGTWRK